MTLDDCGLANPLATQNKQHIVILSEAEKSQIIFDSAKSAIARDVSLALNMTVQLMCAGRNLCVVPWTKAAQPCIVVARPCRNSSSRPTVAR